MVDVCLQVLLITGILNSDKSSDTSSYECPLYRYPSRNGSNFIVQLVQTLELRVYVVVIMHCHRTCQLRILLKSGDSRGCVHYAALMNNVQHDAKATSIIIGHLFDAAILCAHS